MAEQKLPRIEFSKDLIDILTELNEDNDYVAFELMWMSEPDTEYFNGLKIKKVDVSEQDWCFDVTMQDGKTHPMKIGKFLSYFFKNILSDKDISKFSKLYNSIKNGEDNKEGTLIKAAEFSFDPKNPRSTFLSLVTKTYPHGHEDEVLKFLPNLSKDKVGNYYKIIGANPTVMFTSHLDTADRVQKETTLFSMLKDDEEYVITDGNSILGADDKAGVTVMLYMMAHNIPGLYYFFIGEERGGIGSHALSKIYGEVDYLKPIQKCVSFDRRNYHSVITQQMATQCCSDEFGTALCDEYNKNGLSLSLDPTGVYTDSASFIDDIPECTNVSVGYFNEHTGSEYQNITYLTLLCEASLKVDWSSLPVKRKLGFDEDVVKRNQKLIADLKNSVFSLDSKIVNDNGKTYFRIDVEGAYIDDVYENLNTALYVLKGHRKDTDVVIENTYLKIELK